VLAMRRHRRSPSLHRYGLLLMLAALLATAFALSSADSAHAIALLPECGNNIDDDRDGMIDFPAESGCAGPNDLAEVGRVSRACSNGQNDGLSDGDTVADYPADPGCVSARDNDETNPAVPPQCSDEVDNDNDGSVDHVLGDPGCISGSDDSEADTACSDDEDNDGDGFTDFAGDWGCAVPSVAPTYGPNQADASEVDPPQCNDGRDNDGDGTLDTDTAIAGQTADPGCTSPADNEELDPAARPSACSDTIDNDLDGTIDFPADRGCTTRADNDEADAAPPPPGPPGGPNAPGAPNPPVGPSGARVYPPILPFPVIRLRGRVVKGGVRITLLRVQTPKGTRVTIYCRGKGCLPRRTSQFTTTRSFRARAYERRLRAGVNLTIYVTKAGFTGKYTRFRIWKSKPPTRTDRCARSAGGKSVACPVS
jgi:hypothetical protein